MVMERNIFHKRLRMARKMRLLSMDELVALMGGTISKQSISKYERGLMNPRPHQISILANALNVPIDYFQSEAITLHNVNFRCKGETSETWRESFICTVNDQINRYKELETILNIYPQFVNPLPKNKIKTLDNVEELTTYLRNKWQIGQHPIMSISILLESYGIMVVDVSVEKKEILGMSAHIDNERPIIAVNKYCHRTSVRKRFTIAHELAHILLSNKVDKHITEKEFERFCERFAGSFLCPAKIMYEQLGERRTTLCLDELVHLKEVYGISIAALVHRCKDLGIISDKYYNYLFDEYINKNKMEKDWGEYPLEEKSSRFYTLICRAAAQEMLTKEELEEYSEILTAVGNKPLRVL